MSRDILALLIAYLLGSLPFSYLVTKRRTGLDIREVGEGNAGARNVWHVVGPGWGALVAALDTGKGLLAYYVGRDLGASKVMPLFCGFAVALGHGFPLLRWKQGGKGVAVTLGFLLGMLPGSTALGGLAFGLMYLWQRDFNRSSNEEYGEVEHRRGFTGGWPADHCESRRKCEAGGTYVSEIAR